MALLKAMSGGGGGNGSGANLDAIMDQFQVMIENLRKECYSQFMTLERDQPPIDERFDVVNGRLRELERQQQETTGLVDVCQDHLKRHTDEIAELRDLIKDISGKLGQLDSALSQFNDLLDKLRDLEDRLSRLESAAPAAVVESSHSGPS